ncbi:sperm acrosome membrane-associated protein 6 [Cuculus canorus]|uniref:sperm acrosome membrane-associated protein 6 n=1 Tax=Cuculus canorus TaxID=55661 RepID=UPI0023AB09A6|nr:sperm acrosome membrane-associated protein 6 [Cuculus canorus]
MWQWVVLASCLPGVHPCLACFGGPISWAQVCHAITGAPADDDRFHLCLEELTLITEPLNAVTVASGQYKALRKIIMDARYFLDTQHHLRPFKMSLQEATDVIFVKLRQLEEGPACVPPCGYQPAARVFQCATCRHVDCQFPLDCPVQDMLARVDETITVLCNVSFATPQELPVTWMFANDLRTQDLMLFEELQGRAERALVLKLRDPTSGTIACQLGNLSEPVARKYFYLNVSGKSLEAERGLQAQFRAVLRWPIVRTPWYYNGHLAVLEIPKYQQPVVVPHIWTTGSFRGFQMPGFTLEELDMWIHP